jgi:signal transduction histidine kinase
MRLLTRTTIYYLLFSLPLLLLSGLFLYYSIEKALQHEVDEELENSKVIWIQHLNNLPANKDVLELNNPYVQIEKTNIASADNFYSDTLVYEPLEKGKDPYRSLTVFIDHNNQHYKLSFQRSVLEHRAVFKKLIVLMIYVFGGLLLLFLMINFYINKKLWQPFNISLQKIITLNVQQLQQVHFDKVTISEFNALNNSLNAMTKKMHGDYLSMKTFTENASHEIQTPLAIIQSKLELLLQDNLLTEQQIVAISSAFEATQRLSKLNQALLLITKIENNQFDASESISIKIVVEKYQVFFAELLDRKKITLGIIVHADWLLFIHPLLADMLISNLFSNAIRYSNQFGNIDIVITENSFEMANTSTMPPIAATRLFQRFIKHDSATGNGLGLAIVKEICDTNNIGICYEHEHEHDKHRFKLTASYSFTK